MTFFRNARFHAPLAPPALLVALLAISASFGLVVRQDPHRFDAKVIADPAAVASPAVRSLPEFEADAGLTAGASPVVTRWTSFRADAPAERWSVWVDARSGAPALVQGEGIPWIPGSGNQLASAAAPTLDSLADSLKTYVRDNRALFVADDAELVLNREGSGAMTPDLWQIVFDRTVGGVPVTGDGYVFSISHGNLVSFGAPRWSPVTASPVPTLDAGAAFARLRTYLGLGKTEFVSLYETGTLAFTPMTAAGTDGDTYTGAVGAGYRAALTWRFSFGFGDDAATWVGLVDAHTGAVLALYDDTKYAQLKGGVFPFSNDGTPPDGVEVANYPMPFATMTVNGGAAQSNASGNFACTGGNAVVSILQGPYVRVSDACGSFSQSVACDNDLNFGTSTGTDCTVPVGASAGDTHSTRSSFYHLNRIKEHARGWLPANAWLTQQLTDNVNINLTCNAFWSPGAGTVNFYRSGGGCRNTGEIAGVFLHEWGHGMSQNDGAGSANPDEAYGDITSVMLTHNSCIGRGFTTSNCSGYGNACLSCTGVREMDYDKLAAHTPLTPANFPGSCPAGSGPCGKEVHCESYLPGQAFWDLAVRDLPASGVDQATAWALLDRMWYVSRTGTSGNAYACSTAATRSCAATAWMQQLRVVDDDDGNLANGTPHAAAIFAAFNRHAITCGLATDASNLSTTSCPALAAPVLTGTPGSNSASLSWPAVGSAATYNILRNDQSCAYGHNLAANQAAVSYTDTGLAIGVPEYYAVQAVGSNNHCLGPLSNCVAVTPTAAVADVSVTVSDAPDPAATLSNVTYTITVSNAGPNAATALTLTENTTASATFVSMTAAGWTCTTPPVGASGAISCTMPTLGSGASSNLTLVVKLKVCLGNGATVTNNASVATTASDTVPANNSASTGTTVTDTGACDDGNACTLVDSCQAGSCVGGSPVVCTASDQCHTAGTCNTGTGVCSNPAKPNNSSCSDANACTLDDRCQAGACVPGAPLTCTASDQCHLAGTCNTANGQCSNPAKPDGSACSDGNACTQTDTCQAGSCAGSNPVTCTASDQCHTAGTCNTGTGVCTNPASPNGSACNDGNACTQTDTCQAGSCAGSNPVTCTASDQCHTAGTCNTGTGVCTNPASPNGSACNDSNACTQTDTCQAGSCAGSNPVTCTASDQCHTEGTCNTGTGVCSDPVAPDGSPCNDSNACTQTDTCQAGSCAGSNPVTCTASDQCHTAGACNPLDGLCSSPNAPNGTSCEDGNVCSIGDACQDGACASGAPAPPPAEVNDSLTVSGSTIAWSDGSGAFNIYRGTQTVGAAWSYDQACLGSALAGPASDTAAPAADGLFYYLVSRRDTCGESVIGRDSLGTVIANTSPCP